MCKLRAFPGLCDFEIRLCERIIAAGFDLIDGKLEENDEEQATLRRVRELRGQGLTLRAVAAALTEEGFTTKRGGKWYASTVGNYCKRLG